MIVSEKIVCYSQFFGGGAQTMPHRATRGGTRLVKRQRELGNVHATLIVASAGGDRPPLLLAAQPLAGSQMCSTTCLGHPRPPVSPHACSVVQSCRSMLPELGCSFGVGLRQSGFSIQQHLPTRLCGSQQTLVDICKQVSKPLGDSMR